MTSPGDIPHLDGRHLSLPLSSEGLSQLGHTLCSSVVVNAGSLELLSRETKDRDVNRIIIETKLSKYELSNI